MLAFRLLLHYYLQFVPQINGHCQGNDKRISTNQMFGSRYPRNVSFTLEFTETWIEFINIINTYTMKTTEDLIQSLVALHSPYFICVRFDTSTFTQTKW